MSKEYMQKHTECDHNWEFKYTDWRKEEDPKSFLSNMMIYKKVDCFFCKKCLSQEERIMKQEHGEFNRPPSWYRG